MPPRLTLLLLRGQRPTARCRLRLHARHAWPRRLLLLLLRLLAGGLWLLLLLAGGLWLLLLWQRVPLLLLLWLWLLLRRGWGGSQQKLPRTCTECSCAQHGRVCRILRTHGALPQVAKWAEGRHWPHIVQLLLLLQHRLPQRGGSGGCKLHACCRLARRR